MSKIASIGTALPSWRHRQQDILQFMQRVYAMDEQENRKLRFLYHQSGIENRYSVIPDYSRDIHEWKFYPQTENLDPFPSIEQRMACYNKFAAPLSVDAIRDCLGSHFNSSHITHLITVSCTGMSAPGLDLQVMELMDLPKSIYRTSVNFMGCYAAIHALKLADAICKSEANAMVMIVCTELCTLHFQREPTMDNIASGLLFSDGSAAALVCSDESEHEGFKLEYFYSEVITKGKKDMAWELSSSGFLMTLSGYVPELIEEDFATLTRRTFENTPFNQDQIKYWCIHPGGKRILDAIRKSVGLLNNELESCYQVLRECGNMSSATIFFVLKKMMQAARKEPQSGLLYAAAFGPGLTMETFIASPQY